MEKLVWERFKKGFQSLLEDLAEDNVIRDRVRDACEFPGREFFKALQNGLLDEEKVKFEIPPEYKSEPVGESDLLHPDKEPYRYQFYNEYWLCILAVLSNWQIIMIEHPCLRETRIGNWDTYADSLIIGETDISFRVFLNDFYYLRDVCKSSVQACDFMIGICEQERQSQEAAGTQRGEPLRRSQSKEPQTVEDWIIWLNQKFVENNEKRKASGKPPLKYQGSRKIADFLKSKGINISHTTVNNKVNKLREMGLLDDPWDVLDSQENMGDVRLDSISSNGETFDSHRSPGQRIRPEED